MSKPVLVAASLAASLLATPALAAPRTDIDIPPELADPAMADRLGRMAGALAGAMMNLPIGEIEAAAQGRAPTAADRRRTVRDVAGGPGVERQVAQQAQAGGAMMQAATKALVAALPSVIAAMEQAEDDIARATANLPDPTYPRR